MEESQRLYDQSEKGKARHKRYNFSHPDRLHFFANRRYNEIKREIFGFLGNECNNPECPIPKDKMNPLALQIDHINNDGNIDRKHSRSMNYYLKILRKIKAGSKDYQLLCVYCNWVKQQKLTITVTLQAKQGT